MAPNLLDRILHKLNYKWPIVSENLEQQSKRIEGASVGVLWYFRQKLQLLNKFIELMKGIPSQSDAQIS